MDLGTAAVIADLDQYPKTGYTRWLFQAEAPTNTFTLGHPTTMGRDRDWIDYANTASNVIQNAQLSAVNRRLEELGQIERRQALSANREADARAHEDKLRELVFTYETTVKGLADHVPIRPRATLAMALDLAAHLEKFKVTSASFRDWEDKDRLRSLMSGLTKLTEEASRPLGPVEQEEAQRCARYRVEDRDLGAMIDKKRVAEEFRQAETKLVDHNLREELAGIVIPSWYSTLRPTCVAVLISSVVGMPLIHFAEIHLGLDGMTSSSARMWIWSVVIVLAAIVACTKPNALKRKEELEAEIKSLESEVERKRLETVRRIGSLENLQAMESRFGDGLSLAEFEALRQERQAFADSVLSAAEPQLRFEAACEAWEANHGSPIPFDESSREEYSQRYGRPPPPPPPTLKQFEEGWLPPSGGSTKSGPRLLDEHLAAILPAIPPEAAPKGAAIAFGYGMPKGGNYGNTLEQALEPYRIAGFAPEGSSTEEVVDLAVQDSNDAFVIQKEPGDLQVISRTLPINITDEGRKTLESAFGLKITDVNATIPWSQTVSGAVQQVRVREVFYGATQP